MKNTTTAGTGKPPVVVFFYLAAVLLPYAGSAPCIQVSRPGTTGKRAVTYVEIYSMSISGLLNSPKSSSLEGISSGRGRATQVVFM